MFVNGILLELIQWLRSAAHLRSLALNLLIGNVLFGILHLLFKNVTSDQHYFLIFVLGTGLAQLALYSDLNIQALCRLPMDLRTMVAGKVAYYLIFGNVLALGSLLFNRLIGIHVEVGLFQSSLRMTLFCLICLGVRRFLGRQGGGANIVETIASLALFGGTQWLIRQGRTPSMELWLQAVLSTALAGVFIFSYAAQLRSALSTSAGPIQL